MIEKIIKNPLIKNITSNTNNNIVGMLTTIEGQNFTISEVFPKYNKKLTKLLNDEERKEIVVNDVDGSVITPNQLCKIGLDLKKSSQNTNVYLLNFLKYSANINILLENSIVNTETIVLILNEKAYHDDNTQKYIIENQDILSDDYIIDKLSEHNKFKLLLNNKYRNVDNMKRLKEMFFSLVYNFMREYFNNEVVSNNNVNHAYFESIKNDIINTCNVFYDKNISFIKEKEMLLDELKDEVAKLNEKIKIHNIVIDAMNKYKISEPNWKELKETILKREFDEIDAINLMIKNINIKENLIKHFPY